MMYPDRKKKKKRRRKKKPQRRKKGGKKKQATVEESAAARAAALAAAKKKQQEEFLALGGDPERMVAWLQAEVKRQGVGEGQLVSSMDDDRPAPRFRSRTFHLASPS